MICKCPEANIATILYSCYTGSVQVPGTKRCKLVHVSAGVPCVIHPYRAVAQTSINVVVVVMAPTAAPHRFPCIIGLNHSVGKQAVEKYVIIIVNM